MPTPIGEFDGTGEQVAAQIRDFADQKLRVIVFPGVDPKVEPKDKRTIQELLAELAASIPPEEAAKLPPDFGDQLDHYIYGSPKR